MKRRKFTANQKARIVLDIISEKTTTLETSKKYELAPSLLHKWKAHFLEHADKAFGKDQADEENRKKLGKYEHVIAKLTTQNDFLEKVLANLD